MTTAEIDQFIALHADADTTAQELFSLLLENGVSEHDAVWHVVKIRGEFPPPPLTTIRAFVAPLERPLRKVEMRRMRSAWEEVPPVECKGLCQASCTQVPILPIEAYYLMEKYGTVIEPGFHPSYMPKKDQQVFPTLGNNQTPCQFLKDGRCSIYEDRPLVCRMFGHPALTLSCSHGCTTKRPLTNFKCADLFSKVAFAMQDQRPKLDPETVPEFISHVRQATEGITILMETPDEKTTDPQAPEVR